MGKVIRLFPEELTAKKVLKNVLAEHGKDLVDVMIVGWKPDGECVLYSNTISYSKLSAASLIWGDQAVKSLNGLLMDDDECE